MHRTRNALLLAATLPTLLTTGAFAGVTFSEPVAVIDGPPSAIRLAISPDGTRQLYGEPRSREGGGLQIRERRLTDKGWSKPMDVSFNTEWNDFDPAFAPDGSGVYFFSDRPGGEGGDDLWFVPLERESWGEPVNLGASLNTSGNEWAPTPLTDGRLLFSSDGHDGIGGQDLYIAKRTADGWGTPRNLGAPVNSAQDDYDAALLSDDALMLTRSDDPESGSQLFYSCRLENGYAEPRPAGPNINLGGGWALGPSVSTTEPGVVFFSGREPDAPNTRIYRARYHVDCGPGGLRTINPPTLPPAHGYSHVVIAPPGRLVSISGQVAVDRDGDVVGEGDFMAQCVQVFENLEHALQSAGLTFADVVRTDMFVTDLAHLSALRECRARYLPSDALPTSTLLKVDALFRPELMLEVAAEAVLPALAHQD